MKRQFGKSQRGFIFSASKGYCAKCGEKLEPGWHADHKIAHSMGGDTEIENAQALCPACNLKKGAKTNFIWPYNKKLRYWQEEVFNKYQEKDKKNFLIVAFPGTGKTIAALRIAHWLFEYSEIDLLIIVVPSVHLKEQWKNEANKVGIQINHGFDVGQGAIANDMQGIAITYQAICSKAMQAQLKIHCEQSKVLVIFDEVHHAGDTLEWGDGINVSFADARKTISLSGTPWREDNNRIVFIEYEYNKSKADYEHNYISALQETETVRELTFWAYNADMKWLDEDAIIRSIDFDEDNISEDEKRKRYNASIEPSPGGIPDMLIEKAWKRLRDYRTDEKDRDAAMLIAAKDQAHAERIRRVVKRITGINPVLVKSDDDGAHTKIKDFCDSDDPIIVAIRMISEGIDIKRLRVLVYLTNIKTELFFRQICGRIIRRRNKTDYIGTVFIPADPLLRSHARTILREREHFLKQEREKIMRELDGTKQESMVMYLGSENPELHSAIYEEVDYSKAEVEIAEKYASDFPGSIDPIALLEWLDSHGLLTAGTDDSGSQDTIPIQDKKDIWLKKLDAFEKKYVYRLHIIKYGLYDPKNNELFGKVKGDVNEYMGITKGGRKSATLRQIMNGYEYVEKLIGNV